MSSDVIKSPINFKTYISEYQQLIKDEEDVIAGLANTDDLEKMIDGNIEAIKSNLSDVTRTIALDDSLNKIMKPKIKSYNKEFSKGLIDIDKSISSLITILNKVETITDSEMSKIGPSKIGPSKTLFQKLPIYKNIKDFDTELTNAINNMNLLLNKTYDPELSQKLLFKKSLTESIKNKFGFGHKGQIDSLIQEIKDFDNYFDKANANMIKVLNSIKFGNPLYNLNPARFTPKISYEESTNLIKSALPSASKIAAALPKSLPPLPSLSTEDTSDWDVVGTMDTTEEKVVFDENNKPHYVTRGGEPCPVWKVTYDGIDIRIQNCQDNIKNLEADAKEVQEHLEVVEQRIVAEENKLKEIEELPDNEDRPEILNKKHLLTELKSVIDATDKNKIDGIISVTKILDNIKEISGKKTEVASTAITLHVRHVQDSLESRVNFELLQESFLIKLKTLIESRDSSSSQGPEKASTDPSAKKDGINSHIQDTINSYMKDLKNFGEGLVISNNNKFNESIKTLKRETQSLVDLQKRHFNEKIKDLEVKQLEHETATNMNKIQSIDSSSDNFGATVSDIRGQIVGLESTQKSTNATLENVKTTIESNQANLQHIINNKNDTRDIVNVIQERFDAMHKLLTDNNKKPPENIVEIDTTQSKQLQEIIDILKSKSSDDRPIPIQVFLQHYEESIRQMADVKPADGSSDKNSDEIIKGIHYIINELKNNENPPYGELSERIAKISTGQEKIEKIFEDTSRRFNQYIETVNETHDNNRKKMESLYNDQLEGIIKEKKEYETELKEQIKKSNEENAKNLVEIKEQIEKGKEENAEKLNDFDSKIAVINQSISALSDSNDKIPTDFKERMKDVLSSNKDIATNINEQIDTFKTDIKREMGVALSGNKSQFEDIINKNMTTIQQNNEVMNGVKSEILTSLKEVNEKINVVKQETINIMSQQINTEMEKKLREHAEIFNTNNKKTEEKLSGFDLKLKQFTTEINEKIDELGESISKANSTSDTDYKAQERTTAKEELYQDKQLKESLRVEELLLEQRTREEGLLKERLEQIKSMEDERKERDKEQKNYEKEREKTMYNREKENREMLHKQNVELTKTYLDVLKEMTGNNPINITNADNSRNIDNRGVNMSSLNMISVDNRRGDIDNSRHENTTTASPTSETAPTSPTSKTAPTSPTSKTAAAPTSKTSHKPIAGFMMTESEVKR